ncbi:MAG: hypothetical protein AB7C90_00585 [Bacteroidales bacterium]
MKRRRYDIDREEMAREEIARTRISRGFARWLTAIFLTLLFAVPLVQMGLHLHNDQSLIPLPSSTPQASALPGAQECLLQSASVEEKNSFLSRVFRFNSRLIEQKSAFESGLEEGSFLHDILTPPFESLQARLLRSGNEKAVPGREGWLFYEPDIAFLTRGGTARVLMVSEHSNLTALPTAEVNPNPLDAMLRFARELRKRQITLIVMPVPVKPMLYPEPLSPPAGPATASGSCATLPQPFSLVAKAMLDREGVVLFDPFPVLAALKERGVPVFLKSDTHWTPAAMEEVASALSITLRQAGLAPQPDSSLFLREKLRVQGVGDIVTMLGGDTQHSIYPPEEVEIHPVFSQSGEMWMPFRGSEILFLGDSFSNIYSLEGMGWGASAGFAEQLSWQLQYGVDALRRNDAGASATRTMLSNELQRGVDRLKAKRVVIWSFAMRELAFGNWADIPMAIGKPRDTGFLRLAPADSLWVTGQVMSRSSSLSPAKVIYADHLMAVHLMDVAAENGSFAGGEAIVYLQDMKERKLAPAASLRPGDKVRLLLKNWESVSPRYSGFNRSELDDFSLQLEEPLWGEQLTLHN